MRNYMKIIVCDDLEGLSSCHNMEEQDGRKTAIKIKEHTIKLIKHPGHVIRKDHTPGGFL